MIKEYGSVVPSTICNISFVWLVCFLSGLQDVRTIRNRRRKTKCNGWKNIVYFLEYLWQKIMPHSTVVQYNVSRSTKAKTELDPWHTLIASLQSINATLFGRIKFMTSLSYAYTIVQCSVETICPSYSNMRFRSLWKLITFTDRHKFLHDLLRW